MSWSNHEREILEESGLHIFIEPDWRGGETHAYGRLLDETYVIITKRGRHNWNVTQRWRNTGRLLFREEGLVLTEAIALVNAREDPGEHAPFGARLYEDNERLD